jgi:hypothetical protein
MKLQCFKVYGYLHIPLFALQTKQQYGRGGAERYNDCSFYR